MKLDGKVAVITGAAGALGQALSKGYLAAGCEAVVAADLDLRCLDDLASRLGDRLVPIAGDVRSAESMSAVVDVAIERCGRLDVMVNNAGVLAPNGRLHNVGDGVWRRLLDVNLMGAVHGTTAALAVMRVQRSGAIINTGSIAGITAWTHSAAYGVSKAAVIQLTKITALEYAAEGIRANCVCPGSFSSPMFDDVPEEAVTAIAAKHPLGLGAADALVGAFVYLASDEARWTTGAVLTVDGGYSLP